MSAEPVAEQPELEDRSRFAGVLRFYDLAKHQEWQVRDVPWGEIPPVPEGKGSPQRLARRRDVWRLLLCAQCDANDFADRQTAPLARQRIAARRSSDAFKNPGPHQSLQNRLQSSRREIMTRGELL